ncbi:MAG: KamA family radical SAM protein [Spirochaetia bacterium]|jgi:lysine 2,3-aminomutase|nr:KamA family radical SAM protein [Spirochaetia bacterium]
MVSMAGLAASGEESPAPKQKQKKANHADEHVPYNNRVALSFRNRNITSFVQKYFPGTSMEEWNDWKWQISHRVTTLKEISRFITPTSDEKLALESNFRQFPFSITPYYLSVFDLDDLDDPLRKTVIPSIKESYSSPGESDDPLHEDGTSPVPGIVHRYPDRVLFLTTSFCSTYCRYCTRSRLVGGHTEALEQNWSAAIEYIRKTPQVRDVIISGGDPLTLCDEKIDWLLNELTSIPHIEMIRIGTKVPMVLPQRITPRLLDILKRYKPLYMSIHCTHPDEITEESAYAANSLADAGVVMGSQTVLLKGVNDSVPVMLELMHKLLQIRIRPYYLFQCDPITGSQHFRTTVDKGKQIIHGLRGFTSGYAVPQYVIDTPGGGGKVPIIPDYNAGCDKDNIYLYNYEGRKFAYPLPQTKRAAR